ncbi:MAG: efflux RND transporter periplasmic adaptor subunit, partial [Paludibacteraceae bacterium]|nr:efflux RND transporter periplasmic adaptor subunit [Paludibacteraceae bacterium]
MEKKKRKKLIIWGIIAAVVLFFVIKALLPSNKQLVWHVETIENGVVEQTVTATGYVQPVETVNVGTQVSGKIEAIYVDFNSHVTKGQLLAELDKSTLNEQLTQAIATEQSAEAALTLANQTYNRTKELYDNNAATQADFESASSQLVQAKASLATAKTRVREARVNLGYAEIYSTIDGVVLDRKVDVGQTVAASFSTPDMFIIAKDLKNMQVEANIDEADIGQVHVGQNVRFTVDAYPGEKFIGTVGQIRLQPVVTSNVVTYTVVINTPNPDEKLFP